MCASIDYDWQQVQAAVDGSGWALLESLVTPAQCESLVQCYDDATRFRKHIVMERHGFGQGEYKYFDAPLPEPLAALRESLYPPLAALANQWNARVGITTKYPDTFARYATVCADAGQHKPTPLLLRYEAGGYNRLHQDLYGVEVFPLQVTILLSRPHADFSGGEFALTEHLARRQTRFDVIPLGFGDAVVFPVQWRPVATKRGYSRAVIRHGVSTVRSGLRFAAGIIFHGAA